MTGFTQRQAGQLLRTMLGTGDLSQWGLLVGEQKRRQQNKCSHLASYSRKADDAWKGAYGEKRNTWWESCFASSTGQTGKQSQVAECRSCIKFSGCIQDSWLLDNVLSRPSFTCPRCYDGLYLSSSFDSLLWTLTVNSSPFICFELPPFFSSSLPEEPVLQKFVTPFHLHTRPSEGEL